MKTGTDYNIYKKKVFEKIWAKQNSRGRQDNGQMKRDITEAYQRMHRTDNRGEKKLVEIIIYEGEVDEAIAN